MVGDGVDRHRVCSGLMIMSFCVTVIYTESTPQPSVWALPSHHIGVRCFKVQPSVWALPSHHRHTVFKGEVAAECVLGMGRSLHTLGVWCFKVQPSVWALPSHPRRTVF